MRLVAPAAGSVTEGTVDLFDGANLLGTITVKSGKAKLPALRSLALGAHDITAIHHSVANDLDSTTATPFTVTVSPAATTATLTASAQRRRRPSPTR